MLCVVALSVLLAPCLGTRLPTLSVIIVLHFGYGTPVGSRSVSMIQRSALLVRDAVGLAGPDRAAHVPLKSERGTPHDVDRVFT